MSYFQKKLDPTYSHIAQSQQWICDFTWEDLSPKKNIN